MHGQSRLGVLTQPSWTVLFQMSAALSFISLAVADLSVGPNATASADPGHWAEYTVWVAEHGRPYPVDPPLRYAWAAPVVWLLSLSVEETYIFVHLNAIGATFAIVPTMLWGIVCRETDRISCVLGPILAFPNILVTRLWLTVIINEFVKSFDFTKIVRYNEIRVDSASLHPVLRQK